MVTKFCKKFTKMLTWKNAVIKLLKQKHVDFFSKIFFIYFFFGRKFALDGLYSRRNFSKNFWKKSRKFRPNFDQNFDQISTKISTKISIKTSTRFWPNFTTGNGAPKYWLPERKFRSRALLVRSVDHRNFWPRDPRETRIFLHFWAQKSGQKELNYPPKTGVFWTPKY